ncbi:MAG: hypothetical protein EPO38_02960 [Rhizorhabdus sp.]|nr:MAG: hypothetical protein EPO38_02960 [Rhizorhabdus sp.]
MKHRLHAIVLALLLPAMPAMAQSKDDMTALRCILVTGSLADSADRELARNGAIGSLFWLGRLEPRLTEKQIETGGAKAAEQLRDVDINAELQTCGAEMARQGEIVERVGKALQEKGLTPKIR